MTEQTKDFLKFVSEVILFLMILYVLFGHGGLASTTFNFMQYAEPMTLQTVMARTIAVASYTPGGFTSAIGTSGKSHSIEITKEEDIYYLNIIPAQTSMIKTSFIGIEKMPLITECTIEPIKPEIFVLAEDATSVTITKTVETTADGETCKVTIS